MEDWLASVVAGGDGGMEGEGEQEAAAAAEEAEADEDELLVPGAGSRLALPGWEPLQPAVRECGSMPALASCAGS